VHFLPSDRRLWLRLVFTLAFCGRLFASSEATRVFDIPAGVAEETLKQFAAQSGVEVLFSTEATRGVRTKAVKGNIAVQDALKSMLSGTPLYVVDDRKNGVLRIARAADPNGQRAARKTTCDRPRNPDAIKRLMLPTT
jgi:hypothetical protein